MDAEVPPAPEARVKRERERGGGGSGGDAAARIKRERAAARDVIDLTGEPRRPPPDPLLEARPAQNTALHACAPFGGLSGRRRHAHGRGHSALRSCLLNSCLQCSCGVYVHAWWLSGAWAALGVDGCASMISGTTGGGRSACSRSWAGCRRTVLH